ncbi:MAG: hypothetical protein QF897_03585 [Gammaproteobacteria bacterium]|nr:hypothetical protein [Chromatiales bacterium]MDP6151621.1 hypothetical protein [Gammaproteobacteria bacterium]MDP7153505.1 hypothetical protein [Gammaproteobacteria bacterium]MDP7270286.1 hypothetical protein [Gammaproteobacteria bacterium]HJP05222.1 hypothetical protein [Gammaproteobacteria bacterium]
MIKRFLAAFALGMVLTLIAISFYPFQKAPRFPSSAAVLNNGGREEVFFIRLPDDRLGNPRSATTAAFPRTAFASDGNDRIVAELFRVRDTEGRVIGIASRITGTVAGIRGAAGVTDWILVIPSRGALIMSRGGVPVGEIPELPANRMGLPAPKSGIMMHGTDEFSELAGFYAEKMNIEKVDSAGIVHGELTLTTRLRSTVQ